MRVQIELGSAQTQYSSTTNTRANLLKMRPAIWTFLSNPLVAPTNNAARQVLRGYVIKRNLSYCTCSKREMEFTERIFLTLQTLKLQARLAYDFIHEAMGSWVGYLQPSSLVPERIHLQHAG